MDRLRKIGKIKMLSAFEVKDSRLGIGFEKLDRALFDPEKAYDKVAALGVKWVRVQSGWARTEKTPGVYDFSWLDDIVDNLIRRSLTPWITICWGNAACCPWAAEWFGGVGCPPHAERELELWLNYVRALTAHFAGRVTYYEIWNEPDSNYSWRYDPAMGAQTGANAEEYASFAAATADAVHAGNPDAKAIAFVTEYPESGFIHAVLHKGLAAHLDAASFHIYTYDEEKQLEHIRTFRELLDTHGGEKLSLIQGESGCQTRSDGAGAMKGFAWTPERQVKFLLRSQLIDLSFDLLFSSYFSTMDMVEALHGKTTDKASYLDYGYFGVLAADFDEDGVATGEYTPKPSYYALGHLCSVFSGDARPGRLIHRRAVLPCRRLNGTDCTDRSVRTFTFRRGNGSAAMAYWNDVPLLTSSYDGTVSFKIYDAPEGAVRLLDLAAGTAYALPPEMTECDGHGELLLKNIPLSDTPLLLTFGEFAPSLTEEI